MDDDWGSPWADADDHNAASGLAASANRAIDATIATSKLKGFGGKLGQQNITPRDTPEKIPSSTIRVEDPWASSENGFGDEEAAWANISSIPATGPDLDDAFPDWGTPLPVDIPSFSPFKSLQLNGKAPGPNVDVGGTADAADVWSRGGHGGTALLPAVSKEVEVWGSGSGWGAVKPSVNEVSLGANVIIPVVLDAVDSASEAKHTETGTEVVHALGCTHDSGEKARGDLGKGVAIDEIKELHYPKEEKKKTEDIEEKKDVEDRAVSPLSDTFEDAVEEIPAVGELKHIKNEQSEKRSGVKTESPQPTSHAPISRGKSEEEIFHVEPSSNVDEQDGDDDDFGDFADEELVDANDSVKASILLTDEKIPNLPALATSEFPAGPVSFDVDTSIVSKLYPIPTSHPKPPPVEQIIYTTEARKAWYRISQTGTMRKNRIGDDDYVRITWLGSRTRADVNKIVGRWIAEDKVTGGPVSGNTNKRISAMFGWGERAEAPEKSKRFSLQNPPTSTKAGANRNRQMSDVSSFGKSNKGAFGILTNLGTSAEKGAVSSQAASFGWGNVEGAGEAPQYGSRPASRGEPSKPGTPMRLSFDAPPLVPSQPNTPLTAAFPNTPVNLVRPSSLANSSIPPSPASPNTSHRRSESGTDNFTVEPVTEPVTEPHRSDGGGPIVPMASVPTSPSKSAHEITLFTDNSGFDEWGTFENLSNKPEQKPDTAGNSESQKFDEWEAFETLNSSVSPTAMRVHSPAFDQPGSLSGLERKLARMEKNPSEISLPMSPIRVSMSKDNEYPTLNYPISPGPLAPKSAVQPESPWNKTPKSARLQPESKRHSKLSEVATLDSLEGFGSPEPKPEPVKQFQTPTRNGIAKPAISVLSSPNLPPIASFSEKFEEADDDNDWGEMVESPLTPNPDPFSFGSSTKPLELASPNSDKASQSPFGNINETFASRPGGAAEFLFSEFTKPIPTPSTSIFDVGDFVDKPAAAHPSAKKEEPKVVSTPVAAVDSWGDLSFFDGPAMNASPLVNPAPPQPATSDLWDSPVVPKKSAIARESEEDKKLKQIIEGLPDLGYMLF